MKNELMPFEHPAFGEVRVIMTETTGEPWFVAKDVCGALEISNHRDAISQLDKDEKDYVGISDAIGRTRQTAIISEPGLYALIGRSNKSEARAFSRWVRHEVLPAIRKHGMYATPQTVDAMLADPDTAIRMLTAFKQEQAARKEVEAKLAEVQPKAALVDATFANRKQQPLRLTDVVRKLNGVNTQAIKRDLLDAGYLYRAAGQYRVRSQYRGPDKLFVEKMNSYSFKHDIYATANGAALIAKLYYENELTMKKGYTI